MDSYTNKTITLFVQIFYSKSTVMDKLSNQIANHVKQVFFGGNWTGVDFSSVLKDVDVEIATTKVKDLNSIALLVFHVDYYIDVTIKVLEGGALDAHDKFSFDLKENFCEKDWNDLKNEFLENSQKFIYHIEQMNDKKLEIGRAHV